jgi:hypothetical protein
MQALRWNLVMAGAHTEEAPNKHGQASPEMEPGDGTHSLSMCSFTFFKQNVCTVNVHEMYYKFNPGPSPAEENTQHLINLQLFPQNSDEPQRNKQYPDSASQA